MNEKIFDISNIDKGIVRIWWDINKEETKKKSRRNSECEKIR